MEGAGLWRTLALGASEHVSAILGTGGALTAKMRGSKSSFSLRPSERYPLDARTPASLRSLALFSFLRRSRRSVPANQRLHGFLDRQCLFLPQDISSFLVSAHLSTSHLFLHMFSSDVEFPQSILAFLFFFHLHMGRIAKTSHEGKTRKCTSCDTSIQPGVH